MCRSRGIHKLKLKHWHPRRKASILPIRIDPAAQDDGLAPRLTDLIRQNVERHPERRALFDRLHGEVGMQATDTQLSVTMEFLDGKLLVHDGIRNHPDLVISGRQSALLQFPGGSSLFRLSGAGRPSGKGMLRGIFTGKFRVRGRALLFKPLMLPRLATLLCAPPQQPRESSDIDGEEISCNPILQESSSGSRSPIR